MDLQTAQQIFKGIIDQRNQEVAAYQLAQSIFTQTFQPQIDTLQTAQTEANEGKARISNLTVENNQLKGQIADLQSKIDILEKPVDPTPIDPIETESDSLKVNSIVV